MTGDLLFDLILFAFLVAIVGYLTQTMVWPHVPRPLNGILAILITFLLIYVLLTRVFGITH